MDKRRTWSAYQIAKLRRLWPCTPTSEIRFNGKAPAEVKSQATNLHLKKNPDVSLRKRWTRKKLALLRKLYPTSHTGDLVAVIGHTHQSILAKANQLGIHKAKAYLAAELARLGRRLTEAGAAHRYPKGHVPANKGLRRPGWGPGRMKQTQFKKGQWPVNKDPGFYVIGALRINADGYIDMRVSFEPGARGWEGLHRILWEDAHGPIPRGHVVVFRDRDKDNVVLENLGLLTLRENMLRNTIHNLPATLKETIYQLGRLKRRIHSEERNRRSA